MGNGDTTSSCFVQGTTLTQQQNCFYIQFHTFLTVSSCTEGCEEDYGGFRNMQMYKTFEQKAV